MSSQPAGEVWNEKETKLREGIKLEMDNFRAGVNRPELVRAFQADAPFLNRAYSVVDDIARSNDAIESLGMASLGAIYAQLAEMRAVLDEARTAARNRRYHGDRDSMGNELLERLNASTESLAGAIVPWIAYRIVHAKENQDRQQKASEALTRLYDHIGAIEVARGEANAALDAIRSTAADVGIARHAAHFLEEAKEHGATARSWLRGAIGIATLAVVVILSLGYYSASIAKDPTTPTPYLVQLGVTKLALFSLFYYATVWAARNYRTHLHNRDVNRHRHNALKTFEAFLAAAYDRSTKDAILLHLTQSVFAPQATGHLGSEPDHGPVAQFIDMAGKRGAA